MGTINYTMHPPKDIDPKIVKNIINIFVAVIEKRAEEKMLLTGKLEGAHYAAMKQTAKEWISKCDEQ
jgi:hypothetical protein